MLRFFSKITFASRNGAVCVFWVLILFDPQPSDEVLNGEWGTLFDHYGGNLEGLNANTGDVLQKMDDDLILIFDNKNCFQMQPMDPDAGRSEVQCHLYPCLHIVDRWIALFKKVRPPKNLGVTFALASKFTDKYLPFHPIYCNRGHYMRYILYGEIKQSKQFKECPLAAPLASVTVEEIKYNYFKLMDSAGERHDFYEYAKSKEQRLLKKLELKKRTTRLNSWYQYGSLYKSMLRDIFLCRGSRIRRSWHGTILKRVKLEASNGRPPLRYHIELVDKSTAKEAASFMHRHFIYQDNLISSLERETGGLFEPSRWVEFLEKGLSLAVFLEDEQGNRGPVIGCNALGLVKKPKKTENDSKKTGKAIRLEAHAHRSAVTIIERTLRDVESKVDVFALYKCSSYVEGVGLAVAADYEGRGIATELLRVRGEVCRMVGTPVSATVFTGAASQRAAQKCGYKTLSELDLRTYRINGWIVYPNPKTQVIKFMGMRYY